MDGNFIPNIITRLPVSNIYLMNQFQIHNLILGNNVCIGQNLEFLGLGNSSQDVVLRRDKGDVEKLENVLTRMLKDKNKIIEPVNIEVRDCEIYGVGGQRIVQLSEPYQVQISPIFINGN